jgi:RNA polymerase-binding protein DksA
MAIDLDLDRYRTDLEERRARVRAVIVHREHVESLEDESGELVSSSADNHLADTATDTYDRELDEGLGDDAERVLDKIEAALARIDAGTFGVCEVCGGEIPQERLEAIPYTTLCIEDARKLERG